MRVATLAWSLALGALMLAAPVAAQESAVVTGAELDAALEARGTATAAQRAAVSRVLDRPEVAAAAGRMGVDIDAAKGAVQELDGAPLARAAGLAHDIEQSLAGGQVFSINAMTLVIILLLIIIVVLIAD
jgi:hypothetical protein